MHNENPSRELHPCIKPSVGVFRSVLAEFVRIRAATTGSDMVTYRSDVGVLRADQLKFIPQFEAGLFSECSANFLFCAFRSLFSVQFCRERT